MPYYGTKKSQRKHHRNKHLQRRRPAFERAPYCNFCYIPSEEILYNQHPTGFFNFWNWIKDNHSARNYNLCTVITFAKLKENIAELNTAADLTTEILKSILFSTLSTPILELLYYIPALCEETQ